MSILFWFTWWIVTDASFDLHGKYDWNISNGYVNFFKKKKVRKARKISNCIPTNINEWNSHKLKQSLAISIMLWSNFHLK